MPLLWACAPPLVPGEGLSLMIWPVSLLLEYYVSRLPLMQRGPTLAVLQMFVLKLEASAQVLPSLLFFLPVPDVRYLCSAQAGRWPHRVGTPVVVADSTTLRCGACNCGVCSGAANADGVFSTGCCDATGKCTSVFFSGAAANGKLPAVASLLSSGSDGEGNGVVPKDDLKTLLPHRRDITRRRNS